MLKSTFFAFGLASVIAVSCPDISFAQRANENRSFDALISNGFEIRAGQVYSDTAGAEIETELLL